MRPQSGPVLDFALPADPPKALQEPQAKYNALADRYASIKGEIHDAKTAIKADTDADPKSDRETAACGHLISSKTPDSPYLSQN